MPRLSRSQLLLGTLILVLGIVLFAITSLFASPKNESPIGLTPGSPFTGSVERIAEQHGASIFKVWFPEGTDSEILRRGSLYLITTPDDPRIETVSLDQAISSAGSHEVNYFGYQYSNVEAGEEKERQNETSVAGRFPGKFFASQKAYDQDAENGSVLANFSSRNGIPFHRTDSSPDAVRLERNQLYLVILLDTEAEFRVRNSSLHGASPSEDTTHNAAGTLKPMVGVEMDPREYSQGVSRQIRDLKQTCAGCTYRVTDMAATMDAPSSVPRGEGFSFTAHITNNGPVTSSRFYAVALVRFDDGFLQARELKFALDESRLPSGCEGSRRLVAPSGNSTTQDYASCLFGSLDPGETRDVTFHVLPMPRSGLQPCGDKVQVQLRVGSGPHTSTEPTTIDWKEGNDWPENELVVSCP